MSNRKYDWDKIVKDMTEIIANELAKKKKIPTISKLHKKLREKYKGTDTAFPENLDVFSRKIHSYLGLEKNHQNYESHFYQLLGQYDKMSLNKLAENLSVSTVNTNNNCNWLFIKVKRLIQGESSNDKYKAIQKHLYILSQKLKDKFKNEIIFASFDRDTLVLMCRDSNAKQNVTNYFQKINGTDKTSSQEVNT